MIATLLLILALIVTGTGRAQPVVNGAVNTASFASPELPNGNLAQGSMFAVFGSNMGPAALEQFDGLPLPIELAGTSVQVTVGGTTVDCIMIFTQANQIAAILPSDTPVGDGTLTVSFNGVPSVPLPITVVAHSFGIFAINTAGSGPGVFTNNPQGQPNTLVNAANPGSVWTAWGTGLGPVSENERESLPTVMDMADLDVKVFVGGQEAQVIYRGRTPCCVAIDQINFFIPEGVTGCYVPVVVVVEGVPSNFTTISIAESGQVCSDPGGGFTSQDLMTAQDRGNLRLGTVNLSRTRLSFSGDLPFQGFEMTTDTASGSFGEFDVSRLFASQGITSGISVFGSCIVFQFQGEDPELEDPIEPVGLDAGPQLMISGPQGSMTIRQVDTGSYFEQLSGGLPGFPLSALKSPPSADQLSGGFLDPGEYIISGPGGNDVGAFTATIEIPEVLNWTNRDNIETVQRSQGLPIMWSGGGQDGSAQIFGFSSASVEGEEFSGAGFICREQLSAGSFTVPSVVLSALPVSTTIEDIPAGILGVGLSSGGVRFPAMGIDVGVLTHTDLSLKTVGFE